MFCSLNDKDLTTLSECKTDHLFKAGQILFYAGNKATGIYCIQSGSIKLEKLDESGKTQMMQVYGAGDLIGYRALFSDEPYLSTAITLEKTSACFISKDAIFELIKNNPDMALKLLSQLSNDFRMMEVRFQRAISQNASERMPRHCSFYGIILKKKIGLDAK
jgi:CRP-like cAMP-binding protein